MCTSKRNIVHICLVEWLPRLHICLRFELFFVSGDWFSFGSSFIKHPPCVSMAPQSEAAAEALRPALRFIDDVDEERATAF